MIDTNSFRAVYQWYQWKVKENLFHVLILFRFIWGRPEYLPHCYYDVCSQDFVTGLENFKFGRLLIKKSGLEKKPSLFYVGLMHFWTKGTGERYLNLFHAKNYNVACPGFFLPGTVGPIVSTQLELFGIQADTQMVYRRKIRNFYTLGAV